ncbi:MAG: TetR/AcrR family transcriptional regulator [Actinomycetota bacterium]
MPSSPSARAQTPARRSARDERRVRSLDAFIDLVLETGEHPRPEDVARRADVSIASLYRYFDNLEALRRDAATRLVDRFPDLFTIPGLGTGPLDERIASFASALFALHEELHPLQLLARAQRAVEPDAAGLVDGARATTTAQIRTHFAPELDAMAIEDRDDAVLAIAALSSVESWEQFRRSAQRSADETRRAWRRGIARLLDES